MYLMLRYLGSVPKDREERLTITTELLAPLRAEIAKLSKDTGIVLTPDERAEVVKALTSPLWDQFSTQVTKELSDNFSAAVIDRLQLEKVRERIGEAQRRLRDEVTALGRRANLNLAMGMTTAFSGAVVLAIVVFAQGSGATGANTGGPGESTTVTNQDAFSLSMVAASLLHSFLPRLSLVVLIELFSYFFLRLYRTSLLDIKYFQNEMTNVDIKAAALEGAIALGDRQSVAKIYEELARTERNFILKKGESTVEVRKEEIESDERRSLFDLLKTAIGNQKGK